MNKIEVIKGTYDPKRGWYVKCKTIYPGKVEASFLHKDFTWQSWTGWTSKSQYCGDAPGYYPTQAIAQAYLDEYLRREHHNHKIQNLAMGYGMGKVKFEEYQRMNNFFRKEQRMKKGDVVIAHDGSYNLIVADGKLEHGWLNKWRDKNRWKILEVGCKFPKTSQWPGDNYNDTIIQNTCDRTVMFIEQRFLKPATRTIEIDGKKIELSEQSFQNLKKQLN